MHEVPENGEGGQELVLFPSSLCLSPLFFNFSGQLIFPEHFLWLGGFGFKWGDGVKNLSARIIKTIY